jgi:hypothetical protein
VGLDRATLVDERPARVEIAGELAAVLRRVGRFSVSRTCYLTALPPTRLTLMSVPSSDRRLISRLSIDPVATPYETPPALPVFAVSAQMVHSRR